MMLNITIFYIIEPGVLDVDRLIKMPYRVEDWEINRSCSRVNRLGSCNGGLHN